MSEKRFGKRLLTWVLVLVMMLSLLPVSALAKGGKPGGPDGGGQGGTGGNPSDGQSTSNVSVNITHGTNGSDRTTYEVFYSVNGGELQTFGDFYAENTTAPYSIVFFVAPKEGYAISRITHGGADGNFLSIVDNNDVTQCAYYQYASTDGNGAVSNGTVDAVKLQQAIKKAKEEKGCVAAFQYSRTAGGSIEVTLNFYTTPLPTLDKDIVKVERTVNDTTTEFTGTDLQNLKVRIGDVITYSFTVTYSAGLTYSDIKVTDKLDTNPKVIEFSGPGADMTEIKTATYVVKASDISDKALKNTATLDYTYTSTFNSGSYRSEAVATKDISAVSTVSYQYSNTVPNAPALPAAASYEENDTVTVAAAPTLEGYTFDGWTTTDVVVANGKFTMPDKNVTFIGRWTAKLYPLTIHYQYSGGGQADEDHKEDVAYNSGYSVTSPVITGYTASDITVSGTMDSTNGKEITVTYTPNSNIPYKVEHYKQKLDDSYELAETEQLTSSTGTTVTATPKTYEGFRYDQTIEGTISSAVVTADGSLVLKLYYTRNSHTVTYEYENHLSGAPALPEAKGYQYGETVTVDSSERTLTGYTFSGWYKDGNKVEGTFSMPDGDVRLIGKWAANKHTVTVNYRYEDGTKAHDPASKEFSYGESYNVTSPTITGYTADKTAVSGTMGDKNIVETVTYKKNTYTVTYQITGDYFENSNYKTASFGYGDKLSLISDDMTQPGYIFSGWSGLPETMPAENITVTGSYTPVAVGQYTVEHYHQNADGSYPETATESETKSAEIGKLVDAASFVKSYTHVTYNPNHSLNVKNGEVNEDNTLTLKLYYDRNSYTVTWKNDDGSTIKSKSSVLHGTSADAVEKLAPANPTKASDGTYKYTFTGWNPAYEEVKGNQVYTAQYSKELIYNPPVTPVYPPVTPPTVEIEDDDALGLNTTDHFAYIVGYGNGQVRPQNAITRAEVATIFFRLLTDDVREENFTSTNKYTDVAAGAWYNNAVSTLSAVGIITGYPDGTFRPNAYITRAEFAAIAARFDADGDKTLAAFSDIANHWAKDEISVAYNNGWVDGYPDGTFGPQRNITRAETESLVNRVLNRKPETEDDLLPDMTTWTDNADKKAWYYLAIQEATNSHYYEYKENSEYEKWTELRETRDWTQLEK